jgi:hypothetical protein
MRSIRYRWITACAVGVLLAGCGDGVPEETPSAAKPAPKVSKPGSALPPDMVAAVSSTRNTDVVSVHFVLNGTPTVSKALPVDIAIVPHKPVLSLNVHFEARDGLALATGSVLERLAEPKPESVINHQLVLLPSKEGVFMVTAIVETETNDGAVSRIFSIPVIVGSPDAAGDAPETAAPAAPPTESPPASG